MSTTASSRTGGETSPQARPVNQGPSIDPAEAFKWRVTFEDDLPFGVWAYTDWDERTVTLHPGLNLAEARSTLLHEMYHVQRGPSGDLGWDLEEGIVSLLAVADQVTAEQLATLSIRVAREGGEAVANSLGIDEGALDVALILADAARRVVDAAQSDSHQDFVGDMKAARS